MCVCVYIALYTHVCICGIVDDMKIEVRDEFNIQGVNELIASILLFNVPYVYCATRLYFLRLVVMLFIAMEQRGLVCHVVPSSGQL